MLACSFLRILLSIHFMLCCGCCHASCMLYYQVCCTLIHNICCEHTGASNRRPNPSTSQRVIEKHRTQYGRASHHSKFIHSSLFIKCILFLRHSCSCCLLSTWQRESSQHLLLFLQQRSKDPSTRLSPLPCQFLTVRRY